MKQKAECKLFLFSGPPAGYLVQVPIVGSTEAEWTALCQHSCDCALTMFIAGQVLRRAVEKEGCEGQHQVPRLRLCPQRLSMLSLSSHLIRGLFWAGCMMS